MNLLSLLKPRTKYEVRQLPAGDNLYSWRTDDAKVDKARQLWRLEVFQHAFATVLNTRPRGYPQRGTNVSTEQALIEFGRMQGYEDCLEVWKLLMEPIKRSEPLEVTWGVDEERSQA